MNWTFYLPAAMWLATIVGWSISRRRLIRQHDEAILRAYSHMDHMSQTFNGWVIVNEDALAEDPPTSRRYITDQEAT